MDRIASSQVLYVQYNRSQDEPEGETVQAFGNRVLQELKRDPPRKLVIDLRFNTGGNLELADSLFRGIAALTFDLAQQVDTLRDVLATVAPPAANGEQRLVAPLRAYVDSLYLDGCRPALDVTVDEDVVPDWTTEVIVLRIAQAAIDNVYRHAECSRIEVRVAARGRDVVVDIEDDGLGFDPSRATDGSGLSTMRMLARFIDGRVEVFSKPGQGTHVRAVLGSSSSPLDRPGLRLISNQV